MRLSASQGIKCDGVFDAGQAISKGLLVYNKKTHGVVLIYDVRPLKSFTSTVGGNKWSASRTDRFISGKQ